MTMLSEFIKQVEALKQRLEKSYKIFEPFLQRRVIEDFLIWIKADLKISAICDKIEENILFAVREKHDLLKQYFRDPYVIGEGDPTNSVLPIKETLITLKHIGEVMHQIEMINLSLDTQDGLLLLLSEIEHFINIAYNAVQILNHNEPRLEKIIGSDCLNPLYHKLCLLMQGLYSVQQKNHLNLPAWKNCLEYLPESVSSAKQNLENLTKFIIHLPKFLEDNTENLRQATETESIDVEALIHKQQALQSNFEAMLTGSQLSAIPSYMNFMGLMSEYLPSLIPAAGPFAKENYERAVDTLKRLSEEWLPTLFINVEILEEGIFCKPGALLKPVFFATVEYHAAVVSWVRQLEFVSTYITTAADTLNTVWLRSVRALATGQANRVQTEEITPVPKLEILVSEDFIALIQEARMKRFVQANAQIGVVQLDIGKAQTFFEKAGSAIDKYLSWLYSRPRLTEDEIWGFMRYYPTIQNYFAQCYPDQDIQICNDPNQWVTERQTKKDLLTIKAKVLSGIKQHQAQAQFNAEVISHNTAPWDEIFSMSFAFKALTEEEFKSIDVCLGRTERDWIPGEMKAKKNNFDRVTLTRTQVEFLQNKLKTAKKDELADKLILGSLVIPWASKNPTCKHKEFYYADSYKRHFDRDWQSLISPVQSVGQEWKYTLGLEKLAQLKLSLEITKFIKELYYPSLIKMLEPEVLAGIQLCDKEIPTALEKDQYFILHRNNHDTIQFHQKLVLSLFHLRQGVGRLEKISSWSHAENPWSGDPRYLTGRASVVTEVLTAVYDFYQTYRYIQDANTTPYTRELIIQIFGIIQKLQVIPWLRPAINSLMTFSANEQPSLAINFNEVWFREQRIVKHAIEGTLMSFQAYQAGLDDSKRQPLSCAVQSEVTEKDALSGLLSAAEWLYKIPLILHKLNPESLTSKPYSDSDARAKATELVNEIKGWRLDLETGKRIVTTVSNFCQLIEGIGNDTRNLLMANLRTLGSELGYQLLKLADDAEFKLGAKPGQFANNLSELFTQYYSLVLAQLPFENESERVEILTDMGVIDNRLSDELSRYNKEIEAVNADCQKLQKAISYGNQCIGWLQQNENQRFEPSHFHYNSTFNHMYQELQPYLSQIKASYSIAPYLRGLRDKKDYIAATTSLGNDMHLLYQLYDHKKAQLPSIQRRCAKRVSYMQEVKKKQQEINNRLIHDFKLRFLSENLEKKAVWLNSKIPQEQWGPFEPTFKERNKQLVEKITSTALKTQNIPRQAMQMVDQVFEKEYTLMINAYQQLEKIEAEINQKHPHALPPIKNAKIACIRWMKSTLVNTQLMPMERLNQVHRYATLGKTQAIMRQDVDGLNSGVFNQLRLMTFSIKPESQQLNKIFFDNLSLWTLEPSVVPVVETDGNATLNYEKS